MLRDEHAIEFHGVTKAYGLVEAVRGLELLVRHGELVTVLGPSGSGKTTTLMLAAGFVTPDYGSILMDGRDVTRTPPQRRNIGVVFQNYALFPHRTVAENIAFPLRVRRVPPEECRRRIADVLELVRLSGYEGRYPRELSGGQQQRIALARALVFNPPLLLMDEPLGALDKNLRKDMQFELRQMQERLKLTMVYVTHDQEEALTLSDRVAVMRDGRIEQCADPESIYTRPSNVFVATFIGEMNILFGTLRGAEEWRLHLDGGSSIPVPSVPWARPDLRCGLGVRPEHVGISAGTLTPPDRGRNMAGLSATITGVVYLGDAWLYELALHGGATLRAKWSVQRGAERFAPGSVVNIGWEMTEGTLLEA